MIRKRAKRYCIAAGCRNNDINSDHTFFHVPTNKKNAERVRKWLTLLGREDLLERKELKRASHAVCGAHFEMSSIKTAIYLKDNALPTMCLANQPNTSRSSAQPVSAPVKSNRRIVSANSTEGDTSSAIPSTSTQRIDRGNVSEPSNEIVKSSTETQTNKPEPLSNQQTQTTISLTEKTIRKRKLSDQLKELRRKQRKTSEATKIKQELEAKYKSNTYDDSNEEIAKICLKLVQLQNAIKKQNKDYQYDAKYKLFALKLHYSSPHAYRCLKTVLGLPSETTLNGFKINITPKLGNLALDALAFKMKSLPDEAKYCTICVNEMTLKRNLHYDMKSEQLIGFQNINGKILTEFARNACVIMLQGIYFKWKQPLAYALLATVEHFEYIDKWLNEVIRKLFAVGMKVKAIVSDQSSTFDKYAKEVKKITLDKPYFLCENTKIYYVFDVPHLLICIRNNLIASDFILDGKNISWKYIVQLYEDQKEKNCRLMPKITDAHIYPNNFQKIKVKLAVQTLSRTVSAALDTYISLGQISEEARPTAAFIESMNNLFDVLNSSKIKCNNKFQTALTLSNDQEAVLNAAKEMFAGIEAKDRKTGKNNTGLIKSFVNFQISIQSIMMLYKDLEEEGFKYLFTRRLNQTNLEKFFGTVRQQVGCSGNPTTTQFRRAFSKLFMRNMMKNAPCACENNICDMLLKTEDMMKIILSGNKALLKV